MPALWSSASTREAVSMIRWTLRAASARSWGEDAGAGAGAGAGGGLKSDLSLELIARWHHVSCTRDSRRFLAFAASSD
jgi:hypothetical protein